MKKTVTEFKKWAGLWTIGVMLIAMGMCAYYYAMEFSWWPAFLDDPGVCLIWAGIVALTIDKVKSLDFYPIEES